MADCMDDDLLKEVYIGNESCLNSYHQILDAMPSWLAVVLRPMPRNELPSAEELEELWSLLGVDNFIVSEVVSLRLHFINWIQWQDICMRLSGLGDLVGSILRDPTASKYYIGGSIDSEVRHGSF